MSVLDSQQKVIDVRAKNYSSSPTVFRRIRDVEPQHVLGLSCCAGGRQNGGASRSRLTWLTLNVFALSAPSHNGGLVA